MAIAAIPTVDPKSAGKPATRDLYDHTGFFVVPNLFDSDEISHIAQVFTNKVETDPTFAALDHHIDKQDILSRYPRFVHPHRRPDTEPGEIALRLMFDSRLHDIVRNLVGPAWGAQSMFHFKPPTARGQAMHQDNFFLQAHPETCVAAWIAIDDADEENGSLIVVPGSHHELICHGPTDPKVSFAPKGLPMRSDGVQSRLKKGDVLFFHGGVIHGSLANTTVDRFRRALIYHYIPQTSKEITSFYQPLVHPSGHDLDIEISADGEACGGEAM
ncbi:MAG: hypothetical protein TREMPRED_004106 [Tremellales sp. Tagirdzhanova-0007]|nr:MAG: hypothetical protein TREMPRED_004106 [Tremellales sp. Tagirdzhanova-0007]